MSCNFITMGSLPYYITLNRVHLIICRSKCWCQIVQQGWWLGRRESPSDKLKMRAGLMYKYRRNQRNSISKRGASPLQVGQHWMAAHEKNPGNHWFLSHPLKSMNCPERAIMPTCYKPSKTPKEIDGVPVKGIPGVSKTEKWFCQEYPRNFKILESCALNTPHPLPIDLKFVIWYWFLV